MNREEFYDYILENFNLDGTTQRLIRNILEYVADSDMDSHDQYLTLSELLDGFGLSDREIRQVNL